jgi:predicted MFS family arabinose efflux permease
MNLRSVAVLVTAMTANIYIPVAPSILGALVDYQHLPLETAGRLISYNFWGSMAATVFALFILHRPGWNLRLTMLACLAVVALTSVASVVFVGNIPLLGVVRFVNGLGGGLGFTVGCVAAIGMQRMERVYAILYGSPFLISGIGLALMPYLYQTVGLEGAFVTLGLLSVAAMALLPHFPKHVQAAAANPDGRVAQAEPGAHSLAIVVLLALTLHFMCNSGIWTYFERLGVAAGMTAETTGGILGFGMTAAIFGMIAASVLGDRWGYIKPVVLGTVVITLSTLALLRADSPVVFGVATALFNASIPFVTPYLVSILALLIPSGFGVSAANVATGIGFSAGPFLLSFMVGDGDFVPSLLLTATGFVVFGALLLLFMAMLRNRSGFVRLRELCLSRGAGIAGN